MAYSGASLPLPLGQLGLKTDDPMTSLPPNCGIKATNVTFTTSSVQKSGGSDKYNAAALTAGIVATFDWKPSGTLQRLIAMTRDGKLWRDTGDGTFSTHTPIATGLGVLTPAAHLVSGGNEDASKAKKLFCFFNGASQTKYINGDGSALTSYTNLAADWASSFPTFGLMVKDRFVAFGNANYPHGIYISTSADQSDFTGTGSAQMSIFPGEYDGLTSGMFYKGSLFLFKKPLGVYIVDVSDPSPLNWTAAKLSDSFGIASPHAVLQMLDDLVTGNTSGSITSLQATSAYGDLKTGDILSNSQVEQYFRDNLNPAGIAQMHALYYPEKKLAMFTGRNSSGSNQNRIIVIDAARQVPRISFETKDQPNCLALRKDAFNIDRPMYGAEDGFIYLMDRSDRNVGTTNPYLAEFQTPHMDFSSLDSSMASKNKLYDFLEVQYSPTGNYSFYVDYYCDGRFVETLNFLQAVGAALGTFVMGTSTLGGAKTRSIRVPLHCSGRTISFRVYNNLLNQNMKIEKLIVSFRMSGEQQTAT